jgi:hypothetical protein
VCPLLHTRKNKKKQEETTTLSVHGDHGEKPKKTPKKQWLSGRTESMASFQMVHGILVQCPQVIHRVVHRQLLRRLH